MIREELHEAGHRVIGVGDAEAALTRLADGGVDVVVTDLVMPGMDGLGLLDAIRKDQAQGAGHGAGNAAGGNGPDSAHSAPGASGSNGANGHAARTAVPVILMSGVEKSADAAVAAIRQGAADYLIKPLKPGEMRFAVERVLHELELEEQVRYLSRQVNERNAFRNIVGRNHAMRKIYETVEIISDTDATVLITGETGTGKEMVARAIHFNSPRKTQRFVPINCGALPSELLESELFGHEKGSFTGATRRKMGKFEYAEGGTIFLDEIGEIPLALQVKILRVLQEREFERVGGNETLRSDARIIAATNKDLTQAIARGEFREDLFYRLHVVPIHLPPLRDRKEDIPDLAKHFLRRLNEKLKKDVRGFSPEALGQMMAYSWPGNVRQLENILERAVIMERAEQIGRLDIPDTRPESRLVPGVDTAALESPVAGTPPETGLLSAFEHLQMTEAVEQFERLYLGRVLERYLGNIGETARFAEVNPRTLNRKMRRYGLDKKDYRRIAGKRGIS